MLAATGYFAPPLLFGPRILVDPVIRTDYLQTVVATGHVEAPNRINIGSQIIGIVAEVPVIEGQTVNAGDVLVRLDDHEARANVVAAEGAVAQAEARLRQIRELTLPSAQEALKQAQATVTDAQREYRSRRQPRPRRLRHDPGTGRGNQDAGRQGAGPQQRVPSLHQQPRRQPPSR